ncbi:MAG: hypothetical protein ACLTDO_02260 [Bifidobacterium pseudocatenulatum]
MACSEDEVQQDSLNYIMDAISAAGYSRASRSASPRRGFLRVLQQEETGKYHFEGDDREAGYMLDFYENLINVPIVSIEDPFQEEGWEDWVPSPPSSVIVCSSSATTCWSPTRHVWLRASSSAPPTPCWSS